MNEAAPIFVAGLDHSGKTAIRAAIGAHPAIRMVRHIELWTRLYGWHRAGREGRLRVLDALTTGRAASLGLDRDRLHRSGDDFAALVREIGRELCEAAGTRRWGLQEALLEFQATDVLRAMPEARIVHVVRDPRDRQREMRASGALGRGGIAAETAAWIASAQVAAAAAQARPDAFRIVRYETFVSDRAATLRDISAFIGEPFDPAMVAGEPAAAPRQAPDERARDSDVAFIQRRAGQEMSELGYDPVPVARETEMLTRRVADASRWQLGRLSWRRRSRRFDRPVAVKRG